jgi:hypothetical protein
MAQLGHQPSKAWLQDFLLASYRSWDRFSPAEWCELIWGLGKMEVRQGVREGGREGGG